MNPDPQEEEDSERPSPDAAEVRLPRRPRWATVLAVLMLLVGARLFFSSLTEMRQLASGKPPADASLDGITDAGQEMLIRGQMALNAALDRAHPVAAAVSAGASFMLSLILLFAVVAVLSDDPRGRRASIAAGWGGLLLYAGHAAFTLLVVPRSLASGLPVLQDVAARVHARAGEATPPPAALADLTRTLMFYVPLLTAALGAVLSLVLLAYFGGRRGRLFYNQAERAEHG